MAKYLKSSITSSIHGDAGGGFCSVLFNRNNSIYYKGNLHTKSADDFIRAFCFPVIGFTYCFYLS